MYVRSNFTRTHTKFQHDDSTRNRPLSLTQSPLCAALGQSEKRSLRLDTPSNGSSCQPKKIRLSNLSGQLRQRWADPGWAVCLLAHCLAAFDISLAKLDLKIWLSRRTFNPNFRSCRTTKGLLISWIFQVKKCNLTLYQKIIEENCDLESKVPVERDHSYHSGTHKY